METTFPLLKKFNSTNSYFDQDDKVLSQNREKIRRHLDEMKGYNTFQTAIYLKAYDYFVINKLHYDGATYTEDLFDIENLELCSMLHDWLYIEMNCAGNFKYRLIADKLLRNEMKRQGKSSWNRSVRFVLLLAVSILHTPFAYLIMRRRMNRFNKACVDGVITVLTYRMPRKWYIEFRREILWIVILIISITFILKLT